MRYAIRLAVLICCAIAGLTTASAEKRVALVIGNGDYRHTRILPNPKNDAEAIADLLRRIGFAAGDVTLKLNLDYRAMREEVRTFAAKATGAEVALVYYAGHGIEVAGENYLVPVDAKLAQDRDLEYEAVTLTSVLGAVSEARKLKLVILDACRDNPLSHKIDLRAGTTRTVARGLERIEPAGDVLVAYAAKAGTVALDGAGKHSPYAAALLKHMPTPGIDVFRLFGRISEAVLEATNRQQEPWLYGRPGGEAIALVPLLAKTAPTAVLPLPPPQPQPSEAERAWSAAKDTTNISELEAFIRHFGGSYYGDLAKMRLSQLKQAEAAKQAAGAAKKKSEDDARAKAEAERLASLQKDAPAVLRPPKSDLPKDDVEAARLYKLSADQGDATGQARLGSLYEKGRGGLPKDEREAARLFKLSADQGNAAGQAHLGFFYAMGRGGLPKDHFEAARLFKLSVHQGNALGQAHLGFFYQSGRGGLPKDEHEAARLFKLSADQGDPLGQANLGVLAWAGRGGLPKDEREAARLFKLSADQGNALGQANVGFLYAMGRGGLPKDERKAVRLFKLSTDQDNPLGQANLGFAYATGRGGLPKDERKAARLFKLSADQDDPLGQANLGFLYLGGRGGLPRNEREAARLFKLSADQGNAIGQFNLGGLYETGRGGLPKDRFEAARLYKLAADQGHADAAEGLRRLKGRRR